MNNRISAPGIVKIRKVAYEIAEVGPTASGRRGFMHPLNDHLLSTRGMPGAVFSTGNSSEGDQQDLCLHGTGFLAGDCDK